MKESPGDYSEEDLERDIRDGKITAGEAEEIRKMWKTLDRLEDAKKVPQSLLDLEINI